ncbi:MAG: hypothetical protein ACP6KW_05370 [Candidatus Thorarchaeota archaeon]
MFKFLKSDPVKKAKKHIDRALDEVEDGYPDFASTEYEKAARLFLEAEQIDFAVKYFRESAYCALENDDHIRCAEMKIAAADCLLSEGRYDESGALFSEASDHYHREKKSKSSSRYLAVAVISYLAARNFDTATNLMRKADKRLSESSGKKDSVHDLAATSVAILCEGTEIGRAAFDKAAGRAKPREAEMNLFSFVIDSVRLAIDTEVRLEWAGPPQEEVNVKSPIELELRYKCPSPVRVVDSRVALSNSVVLTRKPEFSPTPTTEESWLIELKPVLSGDGRVGPYNVTLEGEQVLVNKHSNVLEFRIARAPSDLSLTVTPERTSCTLGDESILEALLKNTGDGPADNIRVTIELSEGLEIALGNEEKTVNFLASGDSIRFQIYVRAVMQGDELVTFKATDGRTGQEVVASASVRVG